MGWKDDLDRKFLDTIRQLKLRSSELEVQLRQAQEALTKSAQMNDTLARRVTQQTLLISELRESHPQMVEIDELYDVTLENQRMRRNQIMRLKLELQQSRKSLDYRSANVFVTAPDPEPGLDDLTHIEIRGLETGPQ